MYGQNGQVRRGHIPEGRQQTAACRTRRHGASSRPQGLRTACHCHRHGDSCMCRNCGSRLSLSRSPGTSRKLERYTHTQMQARKHASTREHYVYIKHLVWCLFFSWCGTSALWPTPKPRPDADSTPAHGWTCAPCRCRGPTARAPPARAQRGCAAPCARSVRSVSQTHSTAARSAAPAPHWRPPACRTTPACLGKTRQH